MVDSEILYDINRNLETIWQRLDGIEHYLQQIADYGIVSKEVEDAVIAIARSLSKPFDAKYQDMLTQEAGEV